MRAALKPLLLALSLSATAAYGAEAPYDLVLRNAGIVENAPVAEGFSHVIVNGQIVFENGVMTPARPGRVLYGPGKPGPRDY